MKTIIIFEILLSLCLFTKLTSCKSDSNKISGQNSDSLNKVHQEIINNTKVTNNKYSLTYFIDDSLYLFGKHNLNTVVTLIDNESTAVTETKTTSYFVYNDEILGAIVLTRIAPKNSIKATPNCIAVFTSNQHDYKINTQVKISDNSLIAHP